MKKGLMTFLIILAALLLAACGTEDKPKEDKGKQGDKKVEVDVDVEMPDIVPEDFPFPDSMTNVSVSTTEVASGAQVYLIAFSYSEDRDELYNTMKTYVDGMDCDGREVGDQYVCDNYEKGAEIASVKLNIGDLVSTVQFMEMPK